MRRPSSQHSRRPATPIGLPKRSAALHPNKHDLLPQVLQADSTSDVMLANMAHALGKRWCLPQHALPCAQPRESSATAKGRITCCMASLLVCWSIHAQDVMSDSVSRS